MYSVLQVLVSAAAVLPPPVRIMPLGDSLTIFDCRYNAYTTADDTPIFNPLNATPAISIFPKGTYFVVSQGGYRGFLASMLGDPRLLPEGATTPAAWSFVGRKFLCGAHEGYAGETLEWLANNVAADAMRAAQPDVVLLLGGTNDFFWPPPRGSRSPSLVEQRLRLLLNTTFAEGSPSVLLSEVTPILESRCKYYHTARWHPGDCPSDMQANIADYNARLPSIAAEYQARGHDVAIVHHPKFEEADFWIWGIHFNTTGFQKIAGAWHSALMQSAPMRRAMRLPLAHARVHT
jgi:lysophospholipase L1-like esterase